jgi:hypothetical protein
MVGASAASDALQGGNQGVGAMPPAAGRYGRSDAGSLPLRITILRDSRMGPGRKGRAGQHNAARLRLAALEECR